MNARAKCEQLVARHYAGVTFRDARLHQGIDQHLETGAAVLDAGCGRDAPILSRHAGKAGISVGVDLVETFDEVEGVQLIRADLNHLPFPAESFDLVFSRSVLEHLEDPSQTFRELSRVVKPGGRLVLVTPNKYDYASVIARLTPNRLHSLFLKGTVGDEVYDNFPTYFRCNTRRAIQKAIRNTGLELKTVEYIRHYPYYLMFSVPLYYAGLLYDRAITALKLGFLQPSIYMELKKK
jgi:2-polyprenyl-3-methyl-5-hydroxy-6-metoxy-1,4-benzoquinol methylase